MKDERSDHVPSVDLIYAVIDHIRREERERVLREIEGFIRDTVSNSWVAKRLLDECRRLREGT